MSDDELTALLETQPVLRIAPQPRDLNNNGAIFGGWVLSQMDVAGGVIAARVARGSTATIGIEAMTFLAPVMPRDLLSVYARVERVGTTSVGVRLDVIAARDNGETHVPVTKGVFTYVALDEELKKRRIPDEARAEHREGERPDPR